MPFISPSAAWVIKHPGAFALRVIQSFRANQGLLLAGAVAYYTLLSLVPLLILVVIALSHLVDQSMLLETLRRTLEWVVPGQSEAVVRELAAFLSHGQGLSWVLLATMLVFSSLAFTVMESAMSVIFLHRVVVRRRHPVVSILLPVGYITFIAVALFVGAIVMTDLLGAGDGRVGTPARLLLHLSGMAIETLLIASIYFFMPVGRVSIRHALIGGATASILWEILRHALAWYFRTLSQVDVVYGSLTTAIVVLLSLEVAATLLLLGAQVIAEYERLGERDGERSHDAPV
jgi:membrane protein